MSIYHVHLSTAAKLIDTYTYEIPFSYYLKTFFSSNKKYGSRDRKRISSFCYYYFRLGKGVKQSLQVADKILLGVFLCEQEPSEMMSKMRPEWNEQIHLPLDEKLKLVEDIFDSSLIFNFSFDTSEGIHVPMFSYSHLLQPDVYVRIRPKNKVGTTKKIEKLKLDYRFINEQTVAFLPNTNIDDVLVVDKEIVVQDSNSQKVFDYLLKADLFGHLNEISIWDCCSASGGKSILLYDFLGAKIKLTVSDIRASIILNLHKRFGRAGIKTYNYFIADLTNNEYAHDLPLQDMIVCDAPCSGSGTWGRTPEQLLHFDERSLEMYSSRQKTIATNAIQYLKNGGVFVYITCSVFQKENEAVVTHIQQELKLELLHMQVLSGYEQKADSMFVAYLRKPIPA